MSMAEIIAAHNELEWESETGKSFCACGKWLGRMSTPIEKQYASLYKHAADELTKAGYGKLPDASAEAWVKFDEWLETK